MLGFGKLRNRYNFKWLPTVLCAVLLGIAVQTSFAADRRIVVVEDADYFGSDYKTVRDVDLEACKASCLDDPICQAFTYNVSAQWCFLKSDFGDLQSFSGAIAGRVVAVREASTPTLTADRRAELQYLPRNLRDEADRFEASLSDRFHADGLGLGELTQSADAAMSAGNPQAAHLLYGRALVLGGERFDLWAGLALSAIEAKPDDWQARQRMNEAASAAALNAYLRAVDDAERVRAFELIARSLMPRQLWKPAIRSYRAGLALRDDRTLRAAYDQLVAEHGFRILNHQVDTDAAAPRICLVFSESLPKNRPNLADFVRVTNGAGTSVEAESTQICVDGVRHGGRYGIEVRAGLPSADGETIEKPVQLSIYVRDRAPSVRFIGRAYVLPRGKDPTIPLVAVNTDLIDAEIYRVGDRSVAELIRSGRFLDQLSSYRADQIRDDVGSRIWQGEIEVETRLNEDVTSAVPLDDIGIELKPGAYAMVARAAHDKRGQWGPFATQWFVVSDLGLTTYNGRDGMHVMVRSLASAKARGAVALQLIAANNEVLGEAVTDEQGYVRFAPGLARGEGGMRPAVLMARAEDGDYAFLDLTKPNFDLTDRGVEGRPAPGPLDVYAFTERGVYRPGADVHAMALVRDSAAKASPGLPLTFVFTRPDGVEHRRFVSTDAGLGGHNVTLPLSQSAVQGTWSVAVHVDPKAQALARKTFLVEDFQPERVDFDLAANVERIAPETPAEVSLTARYLYGAPAGGQKLEGEITVRPSRTWGTDFKGYLFGLADEEAYPNTQALPAGLVTDAQGRLAFGLELPQVPGDTQLAEAEVVSRLIDAGGRFVERRLNLPVAPAGARIGIRPLFEDAVEEGGPAGFNVILVGSDGTRIAQEALPWTLSKLETTYQWYLADGRWQYNAVTTTRRVEAGTLDTTVTDPAALSLPVDWGRYRLEIISAGNDPTATSIEFSAGWYVAEANAETPDVLEVGLDRAAYRPGDTAKLRLKPRFPGVALIAVMADGLVTTKTVEIAQAGEMTLDLPVTDEWGTGAYVTATLYRPMDIEAKRMPARAIGVQWLGVEPGDRRLDVALDAPAQMRPRNTLSVPLRLANLAAGEEAYVTLAAVDLGILNLTRYEPPAPDEWYFGQRELGMEIRDLYGQLIDRMAGTRGRIRSGGDDMGLRIQGTPPTEKPVALFSGIVRVGDDGTALVEFEVPDFNGTLRLMATAWSAAGLGHAVSDVIVRDPVVMSVSLPRFLAPGDRSRMLVEIDNVDGPAGAYELVFEETDEVLIAASDSERTIQLAEKERREIRIPIEGRTIGDAELTLVLNGPINGSGDGQSQAMAAKSLALSVRELQPPDTQRRIVSLPPGGSLHLTGSTIAGLRPAASRVAFSATGAGRIDVPGLLSSLDRFPYGCSEQMTSRALPLLYLNEVALASGLNSDQSLRARITGSIAAVLANQSSSGGFGLWNSYGDNDLWLDAYVSDFLSRARSVDYDVPTLAYDQALDNLANSIAYASDFQDGGEGVAYALYVLARAGRASIGDLRYFVDARLERFATPMARAQLGAALALYGEQERARMAFNSARDRLRTDISETGEGYRSDYGTFLRDGAALVALAAEAKPAGLDIDELVGLMEEAGPLDQNRSTQEMAWMLLAAHALIERGGEARLSLDGNEVRSPVARLYNGASLIAQPVRVSNEGQEPIDVVTSVTGPSERPATASGNGYTIAREIYDTDGNLLDLAAVPQNTRVVVVLRVQALDDDAARLLLVDPLPAGLEIDNPRLLRSGDVGALNWLALDSNAAHSEFRDDRFVVAYNRSRGDRRNASFAYLARTVTPGSYAHPSASVEDMYRPHRFARSETGRFEVIGPNR